MPNKYYTEESVVVKKYNTELIKIDINTWLKNNNGYQSILCTEVYPVRNYFSDEVELKVTLVELCEDEDDEAEEFDENYHCPALDKYFKSLSKEIGCRIGVPLSYYGK